MTFGAVLYCAATDSEILTLVRMSVQEDDVEDVTAHDWLQTRTSAACAGVGRSPNRRSGPPSGFI